MKRMLRAGILLGLLAIMYVYISSSAEGINDRIEISGQAVEEAQSNVGFEMSVQTFEETLGRIVREEFEFDDAENVICYYEAIRHTPFYSYQISVYKETVEKDILFDRVLLLEIDTGKIYALEDEEWVSLETSVQEGICLSGELRDILWYDEALRPENDEIIDEVLDNALELLKREEGYENFKLMYEGTYMFLDRGYYSVSLIEDTELHIIRLQEYYIDIQSFDLYKRSDDIYTGSRMELYYIGNLKKELKETATSADCFTYEELADGTLRITGYDEEKNTQNPYQVIIPSIIDGKRVSTLGKECLGMPYAGNLLELTISEGITTLEENIIEHAYDISLVKLPDSVNFIDEKAFWRNDCQWPIAIACNDTAYAYQYANENDFACQIMNPILPENYFLDDYQKGTSTDISYFAHLRTEGEKYDFITIEYRDNEIERRQQGELIYHEPNEFLVLVLDKNSGDILQCLDSSCTDPEKVAFYRLSGVNCQNFLFLEDWNFDGDEDIRCYQGVFGTGAASYSSLFAYEPDSGLYENVPYFSGIDSPSLRPDKKCIYSFSRGGAALHYVDRYEYVDRKLTNVARLSIVGTTEDGVEIVDERLVNGEWQIYRQETFYPRDTSAEEPWQDAYDQSECLYVDDGYWDLY